MDLLIRKIQSDAEITYCVNLYANLVEENLVPVDIKMAERYMKHFAVTHKFLRVGEFEGKIRCWILAMLNRPYHVKDPIFQQLYFASDFTGLKAAHAVKLLHRAMLIEAERLEYKIAMSMGSCFDEKNVMARILEKDGWTRRGHTAVKFL